MVFVRGRDDIGVRFRAARLRPDFYLEGEYAGQAAYSAGFIFAGAMAIRGGRGAAEKNQYSRY